tara:strand:+ start:1881 stop:2057 length:177 start_codon:yes stop_codon:yes gene_type:complete
MKDSKDSIRGRRFTSEKSANNFAKAVNGTVNDLRGNENAKSNFKVSYTKGDAQKRTDI